MLCGECLAPRACMLQAKRAAKCRGAGVCGALQAVVRSLTEAMGPQQHRVAAKRLQPTQATSNAPLSATNLLHEIDGGAQDVIARISAAQVWPPRNHPSTPARTDRTDASSSQVLRFGRNARGPI